MAQGGIGRRDFLKATAAAVGWAGTSAVQGAGFHSMDRMASDPLNKAIRQCPVAWLSEGIVEWHGEQNACGLDGLKAETLGDMAAELLGGIRLPHLWLGPDGSTPFDPAKYPRGTVTISKPLYKTVAGELLRQLEAMGFRVTVWLAGHYPGVIPEVAESFNRRGKMKVLSVSENQVVKGLPAGDHAATWETSLLMVLRPGLVDLSRLPPLPEGVRNAGDVIPPPWQFRQRREYYGVYGSDPRQWANPHFGRCGVEAVLDGLAREVGQLLGDPSFGRNRAKVTWPGPAQRPQASEVRYAHLLPHQWMQRFTGAPIVYVPVSAMGTDANPSLEQIEGSVIKTGGMVFPPINYCPASGGRGVSLPVASCRCVIEETVQVLAEMGFRVIALCLMSGVDGRLLEGFNGRVLLNGQAEVSVAVPTDAGVLADSLDDPICRRIPDHPVSRPLDGEWTIDGQLPARKLNEGVHGSSEARTYERSFELTEAEASGAVRLDLGVVENHCEVSLNGSATMSRRGFPYQLVITEQVRPGRNTLKVVVRHRPQPTLDPFYYHAAPPRLAGPVMLTFWEE